jgi:acetoin utilization deacetylase AcuC-like enzyme
MILVSAGYDAHRDDPLAGLMLSTECFGEITRLLCETAERLCGGKIVLTLEGGYDLQALGASVCATVEVLLAAAAYGESG